MSSSLIGHLNLLFLLAIIAWAVASLMEILIYKNIQETFRTISELFHTREKLNLKTPIDYLIAQGTYKNRRIVCRLSRFTPATFLHYTIGLHFYIEPLTALKRELLGTDRITRNTTLHNDNKISYQYTATTSVQSIFFTNKLSQQEILGVFEELTQAAEIAEAL